jgi:hypothetical protein
MSSINSIRKLEIQTAPVFDLNDILFFEKLGEGKYSGLPYFPFLGAFGRVRLARKIPVQSVKENGPYESETPYE